MIHQLSTLFIKRLTRPGEAKTEPQKYLAQSASVRKFTRFDLAIAIVILPGSDVIRGSCCAGSMQLGTSLSL
jgi:hypothetical protein